MIVFQVKLIAFDGNDQVMICRVNWTNIPRRGDVIDVGHALRIRVRDVHFDFPNGDVFILLEPVSEFNVNKLREAGFGVVT